MVLLGQRMAAVLPHLEEQNDPSETQAEREVQGATTGTSRRALRGLGRGLGRVEAETGQSLDAADKAVQAAHAELVTTAWTRRAVHEELAGTQIHAETVKHDVFLVLDRPYGEGPAFNRFPSSVRNTDRVRVLGWTAKMGCPSFSLPAGPPQFGGACPGAVAGQSIVEADQAIPAERLVERVTREPVNLAEAVCEFCYAEGGNYRYGTKQLQQVVTLEWTRRAVDDGSFVEVLDWAIKHADFGLGSYREGGVAVPAERRGKFFRIHDSGDFYSRRYLEAWKQIADLNPDVMFWAPTRIWATNWGVRAVNEINAPPDNFTIRPSQYMVNRPALESLGPGWAAWTTVFGKKIKPEGAYIESGDPYAWDCQTYATTEKGHTCRAARAPDAPEGCRACWLHTDLSVNYTRH